MTHVPHACELITPTSTAEWTAYHDIRRTVLFEGRGCIGIYNPSHPDDRRPQNFPKVLVLDSQYIGVVRIDFAGDVAYLRRVAIAEPHQRKGFGRVLIGLAERFARDHGATRVESAVASDAILFYEKCGYRSLGTHGDSSLLMYKHLRDKTD